MKKIIDFVLERSAVANVFFFGGLFLGAFLWFKIGKEEMPEFASEWLRISVIYPGASPEDVELLVTRPVEDAIKSVSNIEETVTTSSYSSSSIRVFFGANLDKDELSEKIQEVKTTIEAVDFPDEVDKPSYRQFKSSEKSIIDIGLYLKNKTLLDTDSRKKLQSHVLNFKNALISLPEISSVTDNGYLKPEIQVKVEPEKIARYEISMDQIESQIKSQNIRRPLGNLLDKDESSVSLQGELKSFEDFSSVLITSSFDGKSLKLKDIAELEDGFESSTSIIKIQGHEGILLGVKKASGKDILSAQKSLMNFISSFEKSAAAKDVGIILLDDESYDVSNRIKLIASNGFLGFALIILTLFFFLDFKSGFWVGMGIPFSLAITLLIAFSLGFTVNNMTLAAIIIVLGIVVDDAIVVAENISRKMKTGDPSALKSGTLEMVSPIIASVLTTCAAFLPLFFFDGWFGKLIKYIPPIVFMMLFASLLESFFILPVHMKTSPNSSKRFSFGAKFQAKRAKFVEGLEYVYSKILVKVLGQRALVVALFVGLLCGAYWVLESKMKYVMFPREESKDFRVKVEAPEGTTRHETAQLISKVEQEFVNNPYVVGVRSAVAQSRRGGQVKENEASITVEVVSPEERPVSLNQLFSEWNDKFKDFSEFKEIKLLKSRWGSSSGSAVEIEIQENNDELRKRIANELQKELSVLTDLSNAEVERPISKKEYRLEVLKREVSRLDVDYRNLSSTLRAYIEGVILFDIKAGEEEVAVRFTSSEKSKASIEKILNLKVSNRKGYLIPIRSLVKIEETKKPTNIERKNFKRTVNVYADINVASKKTPLEIADIIEKDIFPKIKEISVTSGLIFRGEIEDSRESRGNFLMSILLALGIIYLTLVFLFNSIWTPLLISSIMPFGIVGVVFAFWSHGFKQYGFFSMIGTLGMLGVVVNGAIILVDKLKIKLKSFEGTKNKLFESIVAVCSTRLRAIVVTTITTIAGLFPTAYGFAGYDAMLAEMMLAMCWGLLFGVLITLFLTPCLFSWYFQFTNQNKIKG